MYTLGAAILASKKASIVIVKPTSLDKTMEDDSIDSSNVADPSKSIDPNIVGSSDKSMSNENIGQVDESMTLPTETEGSATMTLADEEQRTMENPNEGLDMSIPNSEASSQENIGTETSQETVENQAEEKKFPVWAGIALGLGGAFILYKIFNK